MNIEIIMIILLSIVIVDSIVMIVATLAFSNEIKFAVSYMRNYSEFMKHSCEDMQEQAETYAADMMEKTTENIQKELTYYRNKSDEQNEMYKQFRTLIEVMITRMRAIEENYKKLLDCWKGIDERYDQTYEQFKLAVNKLDELHLKIEDLSCLTTEDEYHLTLSEACDTVCLDCPYDQCYKEDCPVYLIMQKNATPDEIEGETS